MVEYYSLREGTGGLGEKRSANRRYFFTADEAKREGYFFDLSKDLGTIAKKNDSKEEEDEEGGEEEEDEDDLRWGSGRAKNCTGRAHEQSRRRRG